jgi:hypothetical protein
MPTEDHPRRRPDVEMHVLPDASCLLFDPVPGEGHVLNATGGLVWDYCDGEFSREQIADEVAALVPQVPTLRDEVLRLIDEFAQGGLLLSPAQPASVE